MKTYVSSDLLFAIKIYELTGSVRVHVFSFSAQNYRRVLQRIHLFQFIAMRIAQTGTRSAFASISKRNTGSNVCPQMFKLVKLRAYRQSNKSHAKRDGTYGVEIKN